jgi:hypothetical protein
LHIKRHQLIGAKFSKSVQFIAKPIEETTFRALPDIRLENGGEEAHDHSFDNGYGAPGLAIRIAYRANAALSRW